jgi:hypothetical protein
VKADLTRNTFHPLKHFSRVLLQQGRVQLDADWNEQVSILLHQLRTLTVDLMGAYSAPAAGGGFAITADPAHLDDFTIATGRYYVDGVLVENHGDTDSPYTYKSQPFWWYKSDSPLKAGVPYFVYLDVWERLVTALEEPALREVALGGPDTAARAKIVWQVKVLPVSEAPNSNQADGADVKTKADKTRADKAKADKAKLDAVSGNEDTFTGWVEAFGALKRAERSERGMLKATVAELDTGHEPCVLPASSRYRGENQLWRVEVHRGGELVSGGTGLPATFKVSSDNGSIVYPVVGIAPGEAKAGLVSYRVTLASLGRDSRTAIAEGDWVELVDEQYALESAADDSLPDSLLKVVLIDADALIVTLQGKQSDVADLDRSVVVTTGRMLRRWDQAAVLADPVSDERGYGTFAIVSTEIKLEPGIRLTFQASDGARRVYRRGDYWLIPGREAIGDIEWEAEFQPPVGITHHYAPLAVITQTAGKWEVSSSLVSEPDAADPGVDEL